MSYAIVMTRHTEEFCETGTTREEEAGRGIEIGTELGEGSDFTVLGEVELERTSELLHDLAVQESTIEVLQVNSNNSRLGGRTDTRHGKTDIDGGTDTTEEELSLQENLTVGNGNDLDIRRIRNHVIHRENRDIR